jgi:hypothetical protein
MPTCSHVHCMRILACSCTRRRRHAWWLQVASTAWSSDAGHESSRVVVGLAEDAGSAFTRGQTSPGGAILHARIDPRDGVAVAVLLRRRPRPDDGRRADWIFQRRWR